MAGPASPILKIGQGFGTWLIPIIIFGILGSVAIVSLAALACVCLSRERIPDQEPGATREIYRTPTLPYRDPPSDRPVDATIGRFITHSRSLHVVSLPIYVPNCRVLIPASLAIKRSTHTAFDLNSVLQNYAILLNLHHMHIERHLYPRLTETHGRTDKCTLTKGLTPDICIQFINDPNNYLHLLRAFRYPYNQKDVCLLLRQVRTPRIVRR